MTKNDGGLWRVACYADAERQQLLCYRFPRANTAALAEKFGRLATGCCVADAVLYSPASEVPATAGSNRTPPRVS